MRVLIEPESPDGGQMAVEQGEICRFGRRAPSEFVYPDDFLSGEHFAIDCSGPECRIRDLKSRNGTFLNGARVEEAVLRDGDRLSAGQTHFRVRIEQNARSLSGLPALDPSKLKEAHSHLLEVLRKTPGPLFALLDAAHNDRILDLLRDSGEKYQSLYEGQQGRDLDNWAPYLVSLPKDSQLLLYLLHEGWGKSWGVYLTCSNPFLEVRRHFRKFLMVDCEDGRKAYFRFYDPRVLRLFAPTCTPEEGNAFFGPVACYFAEGEISTTVIEFSNSAQGVLSRNLDFASTSGSHVAI